MSRYYDRKGSPISMEEWCKSFEATESRIVKQETVARPNGFEAFVSTVWLGLDHNYGDQGPPLIFETMVFQDAHSGNDTYCNRTSTEAEAIEAHEEAVRLVKEGKA